MKTFFDSIAQAFVAMGIHPVLGAFIAGAALAFVLCRRGSAGAAEPGALGAGALPVSVSFKTDVMHTNMVSLTVDGRQIEFPPAVMTLIRAGDKIGAIKTLRTAASIDLKTAKEIVDNLAASPAAR